MPSSLDCPVCPGILEERNEDGFRRRRCPMCGWAQNTDPSWLSLVDIFWRPRVAGRRLHFESPTRWVAAAFIFSFLVGFLLHHNVPAGDPDFARVVSVFPWMKYPAVLYLSLAAGTLLFGSAAALCLKWGARCLGGEGDYEPIWNLFFYLFSVFGLFGTVLPASRWLSLLLKVYKLILFLGAFQGIFGIGFPAAIAASCLSLIFGGIGFIGAMLLAGPVFIRSARGRRFMAAVRQAESRSRPMDFSLAVASLDGKRLELSSLKGKVIVLNLWATWCGPCRMEMPSLERLYEAVKADDIAVLAVSDERPDSVRRFINTLGYSLPVYTFSGTWPAAIRPRAFPVTYIIDKKGFIVRQDTGAGTWDSPEIINDLRELNQKSASAG